MELKDKVAFLKKNYRNQFNKYFRTMNYRIMAVEIDALYNVLVLDKKSGQELTNRWEVKIKEILKIRQ
jgi:hypothetical protein